jgi:hypothetical protein
LNDPFAGGGLLLIAYPATGSRNRPGASTIVSRYSTQPKEIKAMTKSIPDDYPRLTPYLIVHDANAAIDFYCSVLGQFEDPDGHRWTVASHVEDIPPEEMARLAEAASAGA